MVQKLAKRESGEPVSEVIKQSMKMKWSYQRQRRGKRELREQVNERTKQNIKAKFSYLSKQS